MTVPPFPDRLSAFVNFPSGYTQSLILEALTSLVPYLSLTIIPPTASEPTPQLQWADYDLLKLDEVLSHPTTHLISSYVYRKALIRKHLLQASIAEYVAKQTVRNRETSLTESVPRGTTIDIQFADELDEMFADELYEVKLVLDGNEGLDEAWKRKWFLVKPGLSDKGQGIRMFSTELELRAIMKSFDPESDDEEEEDDADDGDDAEDTNTANSTDPNLTPSLLAKLKQLATSSFSDDEDYVDPTTTTDVTGEHDDEDGDEGDEDEGTGVQLSQLRHFVIQEYVPRPILFDPRSIGGSGSKVEGSLSLHKFHLRAYVLLTGTYELYLSKTMLALFSDVEYSLPGSKLTTVKEGGQEGEEVLDLRPHLTNTCLQVEGVNGPPEHLVHLFWELQNASASILDGSNPADPNAPARLGTVTREWLDETYRTVGKVISEAVQAGVECGGFGMQLLPNAFEIFGVDLMLSAPLTSASFPNGLPLPTVSLLEFNASPDFTQSGDRLKAELGTMFKGVFKIAVAPFFGIEVEGAEKRDWDVGDDRYGWTKIGEERTRGKW